MSDQRSTLLPVHPSLSHPVLSRPVLSRRSLAGLLAAAGLALRPAPGHAAGTPTVVRTVKAPASGLYELVVSTATNLLYVAAVGPRGANQSKVLGLDLQTLDVRSTIELGTDAVLGLGVNDRTATLFGSNTFGGRLVAIDLHTGTVKARIGEGEAHLREVVVDENNNRVFATVFGARDKPSAIWVVDAAASTLATVVTEGLEGGITGLAFDAKGDRLFATALQKNEVVEVSLSKKAAVRRFASGGESPVGLAFDPGSGRLYCTDEKSGQLAVLDAASGTVVKVLDTGAGALGVALSADNGTAFVANRGAGTVSVVDTRSLAVTGSVETGTHPNTVAVDKRSGLAYVTNKAAQAPRGQPPVDDPKGDTVSLIRT